jgi:hypothetical protein
MVVRNAVAIPSPARARESHGPFVSKFWPEVISLPMDNISARMGTPGVNRKATQKRGPKRTDWALLARFHPEQPPVLYSS